MNDTFGHDNIPAHKWKNIYDIVREGKSQYIGERAKVTEDNSFKYFLTKSNH
jgi:hypothetical protein